MKLMERIMKSAFRKIIPATFLLFGIGVQSQTMSTDHWSRDKLLERAQHLRQLAARDGGSASETLDKYPHHYTMLAFRSQDGGSELHQNFADMFTILDGHVTLVTGGEIVDPKTTAPGEIRGASVKGGVRQELKPGDVVHIPAGTPHQMLVADGETVTYFVVKIEESR
jgi:mannose-6-phosphate isomerase-like protein (cupin superfamily)